MSCYQVKWTLRDNTLQKHLNLHQNVQFLLWRLTCSFDVRIFSRFIWIMSCFFLQAEEEKSLFQSDNTSQYLKTTLVKMQFTVHRFFFFFFLYTNRCFKTDRRTFAVLETLSSYLGNELYCSRISYVIKTFTTALF